MKTTSIVSAAIAALAGTVVAVSEDVSPYRVAQSLANILASPGPGSQYPTDLTRNIVPKPLHSHNDYWRDVSSLA
jgi:hypothetical protein